jgi:hypothetical protein
MSNPRFEMSEAPVVLPAGSPVAVRNRFTGGWAGGFRVEDGGDTPSEGYRLRRLSDDAVLPATFSPEDLRLA